MRIIVFFLSVVLLGFTQKAECDPRLVGKWVMLFTKNANDEILKDDFQGKKYVETFLKNGSLTRSSIS